MDELFSYTTCGLEGIYLRNGFNEIETPDGIATSIHNIEDLHRVIGLSIICGQAILSEREIRFLRKEMDLSQKHLARIFGIAEPSIRHWESGRGKISGPADKMLRVLYRDSVEKGEVREMLEHLSDLNVNAHRERMELEETGNGWQAAA